MRNLVIAAAIALATTITAGASAEARDIRVVIGNGHGHHDVVGKHRAPVVLHRDRYREHCVTKKVVTFRHHKRIVTMKKVCR
ncbi:hypothetical protein [Jiella pelagia]|uniref:Uncharacterized protein n=1 Tax=Jiella pelagia TaxID=2986949 RepID=A0ABY7BYQ4_9HYPH|nr:hypothetical protein [Jiella pelagia]WAP68883.1 hypothetical protein OH818_27330 [Jiella pelagia]